MDWLRMARKRTRRKRMITHKTKTMERIWDALFGRKMKMMTKTMRMKAKRQKTCAYEYR
jgi:hypothetical protein